jgi:hypothetical protein
VARRAEDLLAEIQRKKEVVAETFMDIGAALLELDRKKLWAALGFPSLSTMLAARRVMGRSQAFKLMAVVRALPRRQALALGPEKAYALIRYASSGSAQQRPADVIAHGVLIAGRRHPVEEVTARDISRLAQKSVRGQRAARKDPARRDALDAAARATRALAKRGIAATIDVRRSGAAWMYDLHLAADDLARLVP